MDLENLKDERYKAATSGREDAIDTASARQSQSTAVCPAAID